MNRIANSQKKPQLSCLYLDTAQEDQTELVFFNARARNKTNNNKAFVTPEKIKRCKLNDSNGGIKFKMDESNLS